MPKRKVDKRDIISAAYRLFTAQGFAKTSMADIASACGLLKGSIYHYFDSKESLIETVLQSSLAYKSLGLIPIAYNENIPPRERLERFLKSIDAQSILDQQGNLVMAAVLELGSHARYRRHLEKIFDEWIQAVSMILDGHSNMSQARIEAEELLTQLQGSIMLTLVNQDTRHLEQCSSKILKQTFGS